VRRMFPRPGVGSARPGKAPSAQEASLAAGQGGSGMAFDLIRRVEGARAPSDPRRRRPDPRPLQSGATPNGSARRPRSPCSAPTIASTGSGAPRASPRCSVPSGDRGLPHGGGRSDSEAGLVRRPSSPSGGSTIAASSSWTTGRRRSRNGYIGRAQDRHPQQMIRVDYETRDPIPKNRGRPPRPDSPGRSPRPTSY